MKRLALGIIGLAALIVTPATAADLSVPFKAAPPPVPVFSWSGCYIGVHGGAGWQTSDYATNGGVAVASGVGGVGGGQAGCNVQWNMFVIGLEGEVSASSLYDRNFFQDTFRVNDTKSRNRWDAAISARAGVAFFERAFIYGKMGVIWGKFDYTTNSVFNFGIPQTFTETGSATFAGVLMGVGFEYALTNNWTAKFEFDHIDFGNKVVNFTDVNCTAGACVTSFPSFTVKERKEIIKIGVNYKFGGYDSPVYAKY